MDRREVCISMNELEKIVESSVVSSPRLQQEISDEEGNSILNLRMKREKDLHQTSPAGGSWILHKVPYMLREVNEKAYVPRLISIGPYHYDKKHLKAMEDIKRSYFSRMIEETKVEPKKFVDAMMKEEEAIRKCYEGPLDHIDPDTFVKMLVLDGCFILQLFRKGYDCQIKVIQRVSIRYDLLLLENQLPLSVLLKLYSIMKNAGQQEVKEELNRLALRYFQRKVLKEKILAPTRDFNGYHNYHLLGLVHDSWLSSYETKIKQNRSDASKEVDEGFRKPPNKRLAAAAAGADDDQMLAAAGAAEYELVANAAAAEDDQMLEAAAAKEDDQMLVGAAAAEDDDQMLVVGAAAADEEKVVDAKQFNKITAAVEENGSRKFISSATDLETAGINFKKKRGARLLDIEFAENAKELKIPTLVVDDNTEIILRNMMAYEQFIISKDRPTLVCDYVTFMDNLIDSAKDVQLLRHAEVIENWLGDDEAVANMFNKLRDFTYLSNDYFHYKKESEAVNEHCRKPWYKWLAALKRDYFNSPWSIISFFAAFFLLALTVAQTIFSVLSYVKQ